MYELPDDLENIDFIGSGDTIAQSFKKINVGILAFKYLMEHKPKAFKKFIEKEVFVDLVTNPKKKRRAN